METECQAGPQDSSAVSGLVCRAAATGRMHWVQILVPRSLSICEIGQRV